MTFEKVWEQLKAEDTTGAFAMAEKLSLVSVEAIEYAFNSGYAEGLKAERPQGEWVFRQGVTCGGYYKCSNCGEVERAEKNYCPNCGADMRGEE